MSITLHGATQAWRLWLLPPRDFPHQLKVTLWTTTAIHLDTPRKKFSDPIFDLISGNGPTQFQVGPKD
jgi:hypothetical protein